MPSITKKNKINLDLVKEREKCNFNVEEFATWWNGGPNKLKEKRVLEQLLLNNWEDEIPMSFLSKKELYESSVKKVITMIMKFQKLQAESNDDTIKNVQIEDVLRVIGTNPLGVHFVMFIPTIIGQGTPEQQDVWLEKALKCNIIGTYAQTELGHGTFIRGLETRADYDPKKREFVLNSPTITAYKWWPGGLAHSSNYAIVLAQLYSQGKYHGIQPFVVQLRDEETHMPMPGIDIGNIGSKLGMNSVDNGYLGFKNVRIPRTNMLMKNAQIHEDGTFVKAATSVLTYGTMTYVRVGIVRFVNTHLSKAVTIATRYSAVRRQSPIDPGKPEPQIIDHVTQQLKLFPEIAKTLVIKLAGDYLSHLYLEVTAELQSGNITRLPELHALSCCLKSVCSADATKAIEILRMSCGGHGYMDSSNFPNLYGLTTAACTYEGENTVMLLQTSRFLMKAWPQVLKREKLTPTVEYLAKAKGNQKFGKWDGSIEYIIKAFEICAANKIRLAFEHMEEKKNLGYGPEEAANMTGIEMTEAAELHCRTFLLSSGLIELKRISNKMSSNLSKILRQLLELYAINECLNKLGDILRFINLTEDDINKLQVKLENLLSAIRPNAIGIVDGFDIPDGVLNSALGAYDGNAYERIFAEAKKSPLNQEPVNQSFNLYLKPFMKSNL